MLSVDWLFAAGGLRDRYREGVASCLERFAVQAVRAARKAADDALEH